MESRSPGNFWHSAEEAIGNHVSMLVLPDELHLSDLCLASIVESSDDAIIGNTQSGAIVSWDSAAQKMYGYRAEEVIGKDISILIPEGRWDERRQVLDTVSRGGSVSPSAGSEAFVPLLAKMAAQKGRCCG
jgi:PAS domain-containing protein